MTLLCIRDLTVVNFRWILLIHGYLEYLEAARMPEISTVPAVSGGELSSAMYRPPSTILIYSANLFMYLRRSLSCGDSLGHSSAIYRPRQGFIAKPKRSSGFPKQPIPRKPTISTPIHAQPGITAQIDSTSMFPKCGGESPDVEDSSASPTHAIRHCTYAS